MSLSTSSWILIAAFAVALAALLFGGLIPGASFNVSTILIWLVMVGAAFSAVALYAKPKLDGAKTHVAEKK